MYICTSSCSLAVSFLTSWTQLQCFLCFWRPKAIHCCHRARLGAWMAVQTGTSNGGEKTILAMVGCRSMATAPMVTIGTLVRRWTPITIPFLLVAMTGLLVIRLSSGGLQLCPEGVMSWEMGWMCCEHIIEVCFVNVCCWQTSVCKDFDAKGCPAVLCDRLSDKQYNKHCTRCMSLRQVHFIEKRFASCWKDVDTGAQDKTLPDNITIYSTVILCHAVRSCCRFCTSREHT